MHNKSGVISANVVLSCNSNRVHTTTLVAEKTTKKNDVLCMPINYQPIDMRAFYHHLV